MTRIRIAAAVLITFLLAPALASAQQQVEPGRTIIRLNDGGPTQPTKTYQNDPLLGSYRIGASNEGFAAGGVLRWDYNTTRLNFSNGYQLTSNSNVLIGSVADKLNAAHLAIASQAIGDLLYASSSTAFTRLADVATGSVLVSGGVGTAPAWSASPTLTSVLNVSGSALTIKTSDATSLIFGTNNVGRWVLLTGGGELQPQADNTYDIGDASFRVRTGYFGTALIVGSSPATAGALRMPTGATGIVFRNNANNADLAAMGSNASDVLTIGGNYVTTQIGSGGTFVGIGGLTSSFPALQRNAAGLNFRLADDSGYTAVTALQYAVPAGAFVNSVGTITAPNAYQGPGTVASVGDWRAQSGFTFKARNAANAADGTILSTDAQDRSIVGGSTVTIANNGTASLGASADGLLFVIDMTSDTHAIFALEGPSHATFIVNDPNATVYSTTAGTASHINVYWSAGNTRYEIENKRGISKDFRFIFIGA